MPLPEGACCRCASSRNTDNAVRAALVGEASDVADVVVDEPRIAGNGWVRRLRQEVGVAGQTGRPRGAISAKTVYGKLIRRRIAAIP